MVKTNLFALLLITFSTLSFAADFEPPKIAGLGGAGRAGSVYNDSIYINPSYLGFQRTYTISGNYQWFKGAPHGKDWNASILDGTSDYFSAGLAFTSREDATLFHLAVAKTLTPRLSVGVGGKLVIPRPSGLTSRFDGSVSVTYGYEPWLTLALVGDNLINDSELVQLGIFRELTLASKMSFEGIFGVYFDPHWTPGLASGNIGYNLGLEFTMFTDFLYRLGNFNHSSIPYLANARGRGFSTGFSWMAPRISFDLSLTRVLEPVVSTAFQGGVTVFF